MCLAHGVFSEEERPEAFARLLEMVHACGDHMDVGVLGGRVLFRVLSDFGYADLAYHMITREDFPSYGNWLKRGATTLWENFYPNRVASMNHHFWGDISAWFMEYLGGIRPNPGLHDPSKVEIRPCFVSQLSHANAFCTVLGGRLETHWQRTDDGILLTVQLPEGVHATGTLPDGYRFADGAVSKALSSGVYEISAQ
jgi:alpha-L-rhamnosidase